MRWSELELEGELDGTGAADLVEGVETAIGSAGTETAGEGLRGMAKERAGQVVVGRAEVRMVEDVEEFAAELQAQLLGEMKLALEGHVGLRGIEGAEDVAPEIALGAGRRRSERGFVEDFAAGILRAVEHLGHSGHDVGPIPQGCPCRKRVSTNYVNGRRRSSQDEGVHGPSPQGGLREFVPFRRG